MRIFTGHDLARRLNAATRARLAALPGGAARVAILHDPAAAGAAAYAARIEGFAAELGIAVRRAAYAAPAPAAVADQIAALREDPGLDAALLLHPLPPGLDPLAAALALGADRDIDGQHPLNAGLTALGRADRPAATARACLLVAQEIAGGLRGREVALVGASGVVGRPLALMLLAEEATLHIGHAATRDLAALTRQAEIVISATGVPGLIGAGHIAPGALLIDVGITRTAAGLVGDIDRAAVAGRAAVLTHVPDGVGPVTTACLMQNIAAAALARRG
jgi:methylenetetrahydrofolate dehydrogenase (NADP+)/methenyltetrahydrofolate cyclohydrolase